MPAYGHKASDLSLQYVQTSMDMARLLAAEPELPSANQRIRMFAKSYMSYLLDYIRPYIEEVMDKSSLQQQLYRRFISDVSPKQLITNQLLYQIKALFVR